MDDEHVRIQHLQDDSAHSVKSSMTIECLMEGDGGSYQLEAVNSVGTVISEEIITGNCLYMLTNKKN